MVHETAVQCSVISCHYFKIILVLIGYLEKLCSASNRLHPRVWGCGFLEDEGKSWHILFPLCNYQNRDRGGLVSVALSRHKWRSFLPKPSQLTESQHR